MTLQELMVNQKLNFWYDHVRTQRDSGLSIKEYCEQNNIGRSTFYHYQKKIGQLLCDELQQTSPKDEVISFVSMPNHFDNDDNDKIIIIKGKVKIELDPGIGYQSIEKLLRSLLC